MHPAPLGTILRHLRSLGLDQERVKQTDSQLLRALLDHGDQRAFEEILRRHGPMVLSLCRRGVDNLADAEDAFQATFLILLRRACSIRNRDSLASWLHGVALRVTSDIRRAVARRRQCELHFSSPRSAESVNPATVQEVCLLLEEEIVRLPASYREPFVLVCLEHLTCAEVAARLNLQEPAVRTRLSRARKLLRDRLTRRGVSLQGSLLALAMMPENDLGILPAALEHSLMKVAAPIISGQALNPSQVSATVWALVQGGSRSLLVPVAKVASLILVCGAVLLAVHAPPGETPPPTSGAPRTQPLLEKPALDRPGDPLPPGALARLGTWRFRANHWIDQATVVPGGRYLLGLGLQTPTVILWDSTTGKEMRRFEAPSPRPLDHGRIERRYIESFAVSPDGKLLAVGTADGSDRECPLLLFDLHTGRKLAVWTGHKSEGSSANAILAFVTPTQLVSAGSDGTIRLWEVATQREIRRLEGTEKAHVSALLPSPDGKHLFAASWAEKASSWLAWEVATGKRIHRQDNLPGVNPKLALSPDGSTLALSLGRGRPPLEPGQTELHLYSGPLWKERKCWQAHQGEDLWRSAVEFSPDGKTLATGGADGKVRRWEVTTGKEIGSALEVYPHAQKVGYLDKDTLFTFGCQQTLKLWDAHTGKPRRAFAGAESHVTALAYSPDGKHVAVGGGGGDATIRVWETASGKLVGHLAGAMLDITSLHFSPEGTRIVSGDSGGVARVWDWAKGGPPMQTFPKHKAWLHVVAFSPDGKTLATGDEAGVVRLWSLSTGKLLHSLAGHTAQISALVFAPDGKWLFSGSYDHAICFWELPGGKEVRRLWGRPTPSGQKRAEGHTNVVSALAVSPDGLWLYSASLDHTLCVWEIASGRLAKLLKEASAQVNSGVRAMALSPEGTLLAAALEEPGKDSLVHLWDLTTGQKLPVLNGHRARVTQLAFSPEGRSLASGSVDTTVLLWEVAKLRTGSAAPEEKTLARFWDDLGAADPGIAYSAVCRGAAARESAVAILQRKLQPLAPVDQEKAAAWIRQLDSPKFAERRSASEALTALGPGAEGIVQDALNQTRSAEVKKRLEGILREWEGSHRRWDHALAVLEMIGSPEAQRLLSTLAGGVSGSHLTRQAQRTLARLRKRS